MIIKSIYRRSFSILKNKPFMLWGLSLLSGFLTILILIFGALPIITVPVIATISAGMSLVYLDGYNEKKVHSEQIFEGFKNFPHVAGGMCWQKLWILLWFLIPIAGPFIAIAKSFSYAFTPYILTREPNVSATEALRKSMADTKGYRLNMFWAIIAVPLAYAVISLVLGLFALIPYVGVLFSVVSFIVSLVYGLLAPLFLGLVRAGFYEYVKKPVSYAYKAPAANHTVQGDSVTCPVCGIENTPDKKFCIKCGSKL